MPGCLRDGARDNGIDGVLYDSPRNKLYIVQARAKFNKRVGADSEEISKAIRNDPEIVLVGAYNSDNPISTDCQAIIDEFLAEINPDESGAVDLLGPTPVEVGQRLEATDVGVAHAALEAAAAPLGRFRGLC